MNVKLIKRDKDKRGFDSVKLKIEFLNKRYVNIVLIYRRPRRIKRNVHGTWKGLIKDVDNNNGRIIVGDFNAHNTVWNCKDSDRNGERLLEEFEEEDLLIVNDDTKSRMGSLGQRDTNIDLIFASGEMLNYLEYSQEKDSWDSDHFPIMFEIGIDYMYEKRTNRLSSKKRIG